MTASGLPNSANLHQNYPSTSTGENGDAQREDSPEMLRWRADILMDEMMLGAVDVAAGHTSQANTSAAGYAAHTGPVHTDPVDATDPGDAELSQTGTDYWRGHGEDIGATKPASGDSDGSDEWWRNPFVAEPVRTGDAHPYSASSNLNLPTWSSFPEGDETVAGDETIISAGIQPTTPGSIASDKPDPDKPHTSEDVNPEAQTDAGDGMLRQPSVMRVADEREAPGETRRAPWRERDEYIDSAQRAKRTNLLPRMSMVESTVLLREIDEMRSEIGSVVPETHEWSVRSRHLLGKAETILRHDPERTAEVEYYLNQVRSILQRVRQTYRWSQAYYRQVRFYLSAWIAFAAVVLAGALLYRQQLAEFYTFLFDAPTDSFGAQNMWVWMSVLAAGALGGALGALLNMQRYKQTDHGFLDRKYSLRGLLLPIMAAVVGLIIYAPFALASFFLAPTSVTALILALLPVALAFAYGFFQESFYGTQA